MGKNSRLLLLGLPRLIGLQGWPNLGASAEFLCDSLALPSSRCWLHLQVGCNDFTTSSGQRKRQQTFPLYLIELLEVMWLLLSQSFNWEGWCWPSQAWVPALIPGKAKGFPLEPSCTIFKPGMGSPCPWTHKWQRADNWTRAGVC